MKQPEKLTVFCEPVDEGALEQIETVMADKRAVRGALMADHHRGYSMPIGGVVAYDNAISPTGVGFDVACGNKAVHTNLNMRDFGEPATGSVAERARWREQTFTPFMRMIQKSVAFGLGRVNPEPVDHDLFDDPLWPWLEEQKPGLKAKAADQLGTVGSGNHYVDLLVDESGDLWIANHFGSRGLGHTIASGFMAMAAGLGFGERVAEREGAVVFDADSELGAHYIAAMGLAGRYAYAGRDYVADQVLSILGARAVESVHNHHNYAWFEDGLWVVRKGATPLTRQAAFIGGSMGDMSVIVRGRGESGGEGVQNIGHLGSAPHGAGRVMSRTAAAGKFRRMWYCNNRNCDFEPVPSNGAQSEFEKNRCPRCGLPLRRGRMRDPSTAAIDWGAERKKLSQRGIVVLGAGADESPGVYKDLETVLAAHPNIEVLHRLSPIGVVMAGADEFDPYKD